jgi:hypothetical protein
LFAFVLELKAKKAKLEKEFQKAKHEDEKVKKMNERKWAIESQILKDSKIALEKEVKSLRCG